MGKWFAFRAWNQQSHFGFGTEAEADRYSDYLNRGRDVGHYHALEITDADAIARLDKGDDTDGFRLDLALDTIAENDEWRAEREARTAL